jgi:hypothetical protein
MRTKLNLDGSNRRVAERLEMPGLAAPPDIPSHIPPAQMPPAQMPMEWLDAGNWRLPSGKALAEFALQAGFLAPLLFKAERFGRSEQFDRAASLEEVVMPSRAKHFGKGSSR